MLIALLDADHVHHRRATQWLEHHIDAGWASCAITQNGCVRIMSQPRYKGDPPAHRAGRGAPMALPRRRRTISSCLRASLLDEALFDAAVARPPAGTDAWLLGLAVTHGLRFVTFDASPPLRVVRGATAGHVVAL